ncbi:MAG: hypothetical protein SFV24_09920 [Gemmatimonadales bacterium]|nr:hypothetical protein [Gemmatimonadales bacterium]
MQRNIGSKLEMAVRVRGFVRAHPFSDPTHAALGVRLEEAVSKAQALAVREQTGRLDAGAAVRHRRELRRYLQRELIRYVSRVGRVASKDHPELIGRFVAPRAQMRNATFLARAWDLLEAAKTHREVLAAHGLAATQVDDLATALNRYEAATDRADAGRRAHVGARAELLSIMADLGELVRLLDTLNQMRFRDDPDRLAAWESARNQVLARPQPEEPVAGPTPAPPGAEPPLGKAA